MSGSMPCGVLPHVYAGVCCTAILQLWPHLCLIVLIPFKFCMMSVFTIVGIHITALYEGRAQDGKLYGTITGTPLDWVHKRQFLPSKIAISLSVNPYSICNVCMDPSDLHSAVDFDFPLDPGPQIKCAMQGCKQCSPGLAPHRHRWQG